MTDDPLVSTTSAAIKALESSRIEYVLTGSVVSGIHGEPIASLDIDVVVLVDERSAARLAAVLPRRFYCPDGALRRLAEEGGMINLIDSETGLKVDLSVMPPSPFRDKIFSRKIRMTLGLGTVEFFAVTPEDVVLMKLDWRRESRSQKQWDNALSVARVKGARMDWKYLFDQAHELGIGGDLIKLRDEAGI